MSRWTAVPLALVSALIALQAWGADLIPAPPERYRIKTEINSCPGTLVQFFVDEYDLDGDGETDAALFGRIEGERRLPVIAQLDMDHGRFAGTVTVVVNGKAQEMTVLEFHGRFRRPCDLFRSRTPEHSIPTPPGDQVFVLPADAMPEDLLRLVNEYLAE